MDDLIRRQDAIDACLNGFCACVSDCVDEIEKLPSAELNVPVVQSEQKTERELINRQQAIDKIKDWMKLLGYSYGERNVMECTIQMLEDLPFVQSEWKTGKWIQAEDITTEYAVCTNCKGRGRMTREEAKKILKRIVNTSNELTHPVILNTEMEAIKVAIEALQEQKTGKWIESEQRDRTICSVCGYWQDLKAKFLFSFCPNCGSLMRGGYTNDNTSDS